MTDAKRHIALFSIQERRNSLLSLSRPLGAEAELLHPTPQERTAVHLTAIEGAVSLLETEENSARNQEEVYALTAFFAMIGPLSLAVCYLVHLLPVSALGIAVIFIFISIVAFMRSSTACLRRQEASRLAGYPTWPRLLRSSCERLARSGVDIPPSVQTLLPLLDRDAHARVLAVCGERDFLLMSRLCNGLSDAAQQCPGNPMRAPDKDGLPVVRLTGETEELLSRVREALPGSLPDKPREFVL